MIWSLETVIFKTWTSISLANNKVLNNSNHGMVFLFRGFTRDLDETKQTLTVPDLYLNRKYTQQP